MLVQKINHVVPPGASIGADEPVSAGNEHAVRAQTQIIVHITKKSVLYGNVIAPQAPVPWGGIRSPDGIRSEHHVVLNRHHA